MGLGKQLTGMSKLLISISSCEYFEKNGLNQPLRDTWLAEAKQLGIDYKFFHGNGATPKEDVVVLPVVDELYGLTEKAKAKAKWAVDSGYEYVFSCFPDTYARPERLLQCGYEGADYVGNVHQFPNGPPFCQGGPGYILSKRACEAVYTCPLNYLNDDCFIGDVMESSGMTRINHAGFTAFGPGPLSSNRSITNHLSTQPGGYTVNSVRDEHRRWLESLHIIRKENTQ
jgi:hypothetical protein